MSDLPVYTPVGAPNLDLSRTCPHCGTKTCNHVPRDVEGRVVKNPSRNSPDRSSMTVNDSPRAPVGAADKERPGDAANVPGLGSNLSDR